MCYSASKNLPILFRCCPAELLGHITVEFPPTFVNTPMTEAWSWNAHEKLANVSCFAEGIPNATISWFKEGTPERVIDGSIPNIKQVGHQSWSSLEVVSS